MEIAGFRVLRRFSRVFLGRSLGFLSPQIQRIYYPVRKQLEQVRKSRGFLLTLPISLIPSVMAASGEHQEVIDKSEELFNNHEYQATYDLLLPLKDSKDANVMWRLARASTELGKSLGGDARKTHIYEASEYAKKALELDDNNFACHKWFGILLDYTGEYEGNKKRIGNAFICKEHFIKATELNPKDATTYYCLGYWCFMFADMAWYERKIASMLFASPPTSSYDEALQYFKKAEEAEPGFYNQNVVMIGKTLLRMGNKEEAKDHLLKALKHDDKTKDDEKAREEAKKLLKDMKVPF